MPINIQNFNVTPVTQEPIGLGASATPAIQNSDNATAAAAAGTANCEDTVTRLLNPAFRGQPIWSAWVAAIASGDCSVRAQAAATFDQLFLSSASGIYLSRRAADQGVEKPALTGMADDLFRRFAISVVNSKLTQGAFLAVLDVLYGPESVRGFVEMAAEPYILFEGADLRLLVDETVTVDIVFTRGDFAILRRATAIEVSAVITRALETAGSTAIAVPHRDPVTGLQRVRIYSGSRGLHSAMRVTSGTAAPALQPPTNLFPPPNPMPGLPNWTVTTLPGGRARYQASDAGLYSLGAVVPGDYLTMLGSEFSVGNRGSFVVETAYFAFIGALLNQYVEVTNPVAVPETVTQLAYGSVEFFRPTKRTQQDSPTRAVVLQRGGSAEVSIAATTQAVNRHQGTGAYLHAAPSFEVTSVSRTPSGAVELTTSVPHHLISGQTFFLDGVETSTVIPFPSGANGSGSFTASSVAEGNTGTDPISAWNQDFTFEGADFKTLRDLDGDFWLFGGNIYSSAAGTPTGINTATTFRVKAENKNGVDAVSTVYRWTTGTMGAGYSLGTAPVVLDDALHHNSIRLVGGYVTSPWGGPSAALPVTTAVDVITKNYTKETALIRNQFSAAGWMSALALWFTANPISGDVLTISDGATTRTYGFGVGGDVTVPIGVDTTDTEANLQASVAGDGGAQWGATAVLSVFSVPAVVIAEFQPIDPKSGLRVYGNAGMASRTNVAVYADSIQALPTYDAPLAIIPLPSSNPGYGQAGAHKTPFDLVFGEIHEYLNGPGFVQWSGVDWNDTINWHDSAATGGSLSAPTAEATATWLLGPAKILVAGGIDAYNRATATIQEGLSAWSTMPASLKAARCQHAAIKLDGTHVLLIGGRQPATSTLRSGLGYTSWNFEEAPAAVTFAGPVTIGIGANSRLAGKIGYGLNLSGSASTSSGGGAQAALNTSLLSSWTISGWMTAARGCVFRNGVAAWGAQADNTLISFGVDPTDDKFFIRWNEGVILTTITKKTAATRQILMGNNLSTPFPRYHHFAITKAVSGPNATFLLYINGAIAGTWTDLKPDGGSNGLFSFGQADGAVARFAGCVDAVGFTTTVLTADEILQQFQAEVGVLYDNPTDASASPVGKVLNSCEIVPENASGGNPSVFTGSMTYARFAAAVVGLPDGRIIACGGVGYNPSTDAFPSAAAQRALELKSAEIYDPLLGIWTPLPDMRESHSYCAAAYVASENRVYVSGGMMSGATEYLDLTTMRWSVSSASFPILGVRAKAGGGLAGSKTLVLAGGAIYNTTTNSQPVWETTTGGQLDYIMPIGGESLYSGGLNGLQIAANGTVGSTIVLSNPGRAYTSVSPAAAVVAAATAPAGGIKGPFIFDPKGGFGIKSVVGDLASRVEAGRSYGVLTLNSGQGLNFPDAPGYIVVDFGFSNQVGPVRYLGRFTADALLIDAGFKWPKTIESGAEVRLLVGRAPFVPDRPETVGAFYATAASAGRVAAVATLQEISAAGIDLNITVRFPGDRGMGGEGRPVRGSYKLSDVVTVFAGNDIDAETAAAKAG